MRLLRMMVTLLLLLLLPPSLFAAEQGFARLSLIEGDVQVRVADSDDWLPAATNTPLYEGDGVWTPGGSRAEVQLKDGSVIRLDARSALNVLKVERDFLQFNLAMGRAYLRTVADMEWSLQFDLAESTVRVDDKGRYRLEIDSSGEEDISVFRGSAYVESYGGRTRVRTGEMLTVEDSRSEISPVNPKDAWDSWNSERDASQARRQAGGERRLPEELVIYEEELSSAGEWIVVREYGHVWRPRLYVSAGWAPYREGRWIWRGGDYVWVSHEPWGWVPYHYGRWTIIAGYGWCWVPPLAGDVFWAPGYVGWVTTPTHVGWVPLAPGEVYYGRGYYGRHSVNVTNVTNITIINRRNVYRNAARSNGVTSVERSSFVTGRGRYTRHSGDIFRKERVLAGRPEPRLDSREIRMPRVRNIPTDRLPPKTVVSQPVRELRERFPRVERGAQVKPLRDERRQQTREPSRQSEHGRERGPLPGRQVDGGVAERKQPLVRPVTPDTHRPQPQPQVRPAESGEQSAPAPVRGSGERGGRVEGPKPGANKGGDAAPMQRGKTQDASGTVGSGDSTGRQAPAAVSSERKESRGRKDVGVRDSGPTRERRASGVWKIKPKEEPPKEKEKEKERK